MKINEQITDDKTTEREKLKNFYSLGCLPKWLENPKLITYNGKQAISGLNSKKQQVLFYSDLTGENLTTKLKAKWSCDKVAGQTSGILSNFGVTKNDENKVKQFTTILQGYINQGAVSDVFGQWNKMLETNFPNVTKLAPSKEYDSSFDLPLNKIDLDSKYEPIKDLNTRWGWGNNVIIHLPNPKNQDLTDQGKVNLNKDDCDKKLRAFFVSAIQTNAGITQAIRKSEINNYQEIIQQCRANNQYADFSGISKNDVSQLTNDLSPFGFFEMGSKLTGGKLSFNNVKKIFKGETKYLEGPDSGLAKSYVFNIDSTDKIRTTQRESKLDNLGLLIKENLIISLREKKNTILTENNIIKQRTSILLEGGIPKTKKGQERLIDEIINEAISLNSQGLDKDLINESFWDTIKGLFGNYAGGGLVEMFKEKFMRYLIGKLTPADPDGWTAGVIEKAFGNIPVADYFNGKILQCDYLTHVLTKSLVEEVIAKAGQSSMGSKIGGESIVFDVLRNSIVNQLDDTDFAKNIEHGLSKFVCPAIQGISGKMDKAVDQMRDKALKP